MSNFTGAQDVGCHESTMAEPSNPPQDEDNGPVSDSMDEPTSPHALTSMKDQMDVVSTRASIDKAVMSAKDQHSEHKGRPVRSLDGFGDFRSARYAAYEIRRRGLSSAKIASIKVKIRDCIRGVNHTYKGSRWVYTDEAHASVSGSCMW